MADNVLNLDELEELNPDPLVVVLKGKRIVIQELEHKLYFQTNERFESLQANIARAAFTVKELEQEEIDLLMMILEPFNPELERAFFDTVTERKLSYLLQQAMEYQQAFAKTVEASLPNSRAARRAAKRGSTGNGSTRR